MCDIGLILQALQCFCGSKGGWSCVKLIPSIITESHTALNQLDKFKPNLLNK